MITSLSIVVNYFCLIIWLSSTYAGLAVSRGSGVTKMSSLGMMPSSSSMSLMVSSAVLGLLFSWLR